MKIFHGLLLVGGYCLLAGACKKSPNYNEDYYGQGTGVCRIVQAKTISGMAPVSTLTFAYDDQNRIARIDNERWNGTTSTTFDYGDHFLRARHLGISGQLNNSDSLRLNDKGQITDRYLFSASGWLQVYAHMTYDAAGQLATLASYLPGGTLTRFESFKWQNGDMIEDSTSHGIYRFTYTGIPAQFFNLAQLYNITDLGRPLWRNAHMERTYTATTVPGAISYNYAFDPGGKIVADSAYNTGSSTGSTTTLTYDCHTP